MNNEIILGIDETGRSPVIGSMPICGVLVPTSDFDHLYNGLGVRDSKQIEKKINSLGKELKKTYENTVFMISPQEITNSDNINKLEAGYILRLVEKYYDRVDKIIIDSICSDPEKLFEYCGKLNDYRDKLVIQCKADENYIPVMVASIIAKYHNNSETIYLNNKYNTGSGCPSDTKTLLYLTNNLDNPDKIIRERWLTFRRIKENKKLRDKLRDIINSKSFSTKGLKELYDTKD